MRDRETLLRTPERMRKNRAPLQESAMPGAKLDPIDRRILAELQADGRMTNVELSRRVGISAPPCLRRVRTLEESGLIQGYHARINARELGFEVQVFAMIRLSSQAERDLSTFQSFLTEELTAAPNVASVKTSLVIRCAKDEPAVPFDIYEARARARD
jgi:DNA-binding Lrp family transcriptional regulator